MTLNSSDLLRASAESQLTRMPSTPTAGLSADKLQHELQVYEIELEMQNEELRAAQLALQAALDNYVSLYEYAPISYLSLTAEGRIAEINLTGVALLGEAREKLLNRRFSSLLSSKDTDRWHLLFTSLMRREKKEMSFELTLQTGQQRVLQIQANCVFLIAHNAAPTVRMALIDITEAYEYKQKELDLRISATAFEVHDSMVVTDVTGDILRVNQAFVDLTGYTKAEVVGKNLRLLKSGRHDKAFYGAIWESILHIGCWKGEIWDRRKNGEHFLCWLSITAVKASDGGITHYVATHIDITERKAAEAQIFKLAFYDPLTQLPNRRLLHDRLTSGIETAWRTDRQLAVLMLDLDRFKPINDSLGHLAGDELLQQVAARITALLRDDDMVARLGSDEFVVLLEDLASPHDASRVADEIIAELSRPFKLNQHDDVRIGVSIGISLLAQHGDTPQVLMHNADAALYQAKEQGRGCASYFSQEFTAAVLARIALGSRLQRAIEQQELRVFYQPQVHIASGKIIGAEALVRWHDPIYGLISPTRFIPVAEETQLIVEIGAWILREVCRQGRLWLDNGLPPLTLAVNVSAQQFRRCDVNALVAEVLAETGFPVEQLKLEITESGLMEYQDSITEILQSLYDQGLRLAIDDFGTGYSSLARLKSFPVDVLKIDKSFIDHIPDNKDDTEIASTIVALGHALGFRVLAEGVETPEQLAFLTEIGCDSYQGYIKSCPLSAEEFAEFYLRHI